MEKFASLFQKLDETNKTTLKVEAMSHYFQQASDEDKIWAIALMSGKKPRRPVSTTTLRTWAAELAEIPLWLFEESYHVAGDLAETIALLTSNKYKNHENSENLTLSKWMDFVIALKAMDESQQKDALIHAWKSFDYMESFVFNKLITGSFRVGVSRKLMTRALANAFDLDENALAHRLMGNWDPVSTTFEDLIFTKHERDNTSKPYPFFLAYGLEGKVETLGKREQWQVEWKWDGIRGQIIKRGGELFVWSRGEELVSDKYPEYFTLKDDLPNGTVLDGEILAFKSDFPLNFNSLQQRIGRKNISKKMLDDIPVVFMAYDLLEWEHEDWRTKPLYERRKKLEELIEKSNSPQLLLSPIVDFKEWEELDTEILRSRELGNEGFMIKRLDSVYEVGRKKGSWWKWKSDPFTIDAVLTFAMRGHGRRANLYTDYTFGLWHEGELVTFAKAYSGLTDKEFEEIDRFIKRNTLERFGPVRQVKPQLVFELAFEGIAYSKRHKSGVAVRFPRILRWRRDKKAEEANQLQELIVLIPGNEEGN